RLRVKRVRPAARLPSQIVLGDEMVDETAARALFGLHELYCERVVEALPFAPHVVAMLGPETLEIRFPGVTAQPDVRADVDRSLLTGPSLFFQEQSEARGEALSLAEIRPAESEFSARVAKPARRHECIERILLETRADDHVE